MQGFTTCIERHFKALVLQQPCVASSKSAHKNSFTLLMRHLATFVFHMRMHRGVHFARFPDGVVWHHAWKGRERFVGPMTGRPALRGLAPGLQGLPESSGARPHCASQACRAFPGEASFTDRGGVPRALGEPLLCLSPTPQPRLRRLALHPASPRPPQHAAEHCQKFGRKLTTYLF